MQPTIILTFKLFSQIEASQSKINECCRKKKKALVPEDVENEGKSDLSDN